MVKTAHIFAIAVVASGGLLYWLSPDDKVGASLNPEPSAASAQSLSEHNSASRAERTDSNIPDASSSPKATLSLPPNNAIQSADAKITQDILAHFATGNFIKAAQLADEHLLADSGSEALHAWIVAQLPTLLTSAGWIYLKQGSCDEAIQYFRRAEILKRSAETAKGLAVCHYKQKNHISAREQFAYYLERQQDDAQMLFLYADSLESEGAYNEAIVALERAQALPNDGSKIDTQAIEQRLASMRARSRESQFQSTEGSRNFRLTFRAGEHEDLVAYIFSTLESALDEFIEIYGLRAPLSPIEVVLYPANDFNNNVAGGPEWAEGVFDGRIRIPIRDAILASRQWGSLSKVLRHELVHALLTSATDNRSLPPWLDEGLAQRLACGTSGCGAFYYPPTPGQFLPIQAFSTHYITFKSEKAARAYQQSLFLIEVIEHRFDNGLRRLVEGIVNRRTNSDSLLEPFGTNFRDLHRDSTKLWSERQQPSAIALDR